MFGFPIIVILEENLHLPYLPNLQKSATHESKKTSRGSMQ